MSWLEQVMLTALLSLSPIWIALIIGAICWAARYFGDPTNRNATRRNAQYRMSRYETRRNRHARANGGVRHG